MSLTTRLALGILAFAFPLGTARAEDPRFGVQVHGNLPSGDLKDAVDSKLGVGGGAHVTFDLGGGHVIRPRIDYTFFPETTLNSGTFTVKNKISTLGAGADYLYFIDGKPEGLYVTGGLAFHHWKADVTAGAATYSDSSNKAGFAAGVGFNFNASFGAELRFTSSRYGSNSKEFTANAIQAGVTLRF
jgi:opacity protein-like surface antigen